MRASLLVPSRPRTAIVVFAAGAFLLPLLVEPARAIQSPWPWSVPALLAFVLFVGVMSFVQGARLGALTLVIGALTSLTAPLLRPDMVATPASSGSVTANLIVTTSVAAAMFLIAVLVAGRVRVAAELTRRRSTAPWRSRGAPSWRSAPGSPGSCTTSWRTACR